MESEVEAIKKANQKKTPVKRKAPVKRKVSSKQENTKMENVSQVISPVELELKDERILPQLSVTDNVISKDPDDFEIPEDLAGMITTSEKESEEMKNEIGELSVTDADINGDVVETKSEVKGGPKAQPISRLFSKADLEPYINKTYSEREIVNLKQKIQMYYAKFPELNTLLPLPKNFAKIKEGAQLEYWLQKIKNSLNYSGFSTLVEDNFFHLMGALETIICEFNFDIKGWTEDTKDKSENDIKRILAELSIDYFDYYQDIGNPFGRLAFILCTSMYKTYKDNKNGARRVEYSSPVKKEIFNEYSDLILGARAGKLDETKQIPR